MGSSLGRAGDNLLPSVQVCTFHQTIPALASFCSSKSVCSFEACGYPIAARSRKGRHCEIMGGIYPVGSTWARGAAGESTSLLLVERGKWGHKHPTAALIKSSSSLMLSQAFHLESSGLFPCSISFLKV